MKKSILLICFFGLFDLLRAEPCFTENTACTLDSSNLVGAYENIGTLSECRAICKDEPECEYFTFYSSSLTPSFHRKCYLFTYCQETMDFSGAISGVTGDCTCSLEAEPQDGSLVKVLYAEKELDCKRSCGLEAECEFYTFFGLANDCKLLKNVSSFGESSMDVYKTGPRDCESSNGLCSFAFLGNFVDHVMLVNDSRSYSVDVRSGMIDCMINLSIVLVGAGGENNYGSSACYTGAGGSGFVNQTIVSLTPPVTLDVSFSHSWPSGISVSVNNEEILNTTNGGDGWHRGDGYSGGGVGFGAPGGEDGGDGGCGVRYTTTSTEQYYTTTTISSTTESQCGGKGQGIDIRQFSSPHFLLTPGPAGSDTECNNGGGGVLVNGLGPKQGTSFGMGGSHRQSPGRAVALLDIN